MPISNTLRALDGGIYQNADGLTTDKNGVPISGGQAIYVTALPTTSAPFGSLAYDPIGRRLWVQAANPSGNTWNQEI